MEGGALALECTLGGKDSPPPMQFDFDGPGAYSGFLVFVTPPTITNTTAPMPLLVVSDHGHGAVHLVDVVKQRHAGYVAAPWSIAGPHGVAACNTGTLAKVAVSSWKDSRSGRSWKESHSARHVVHIFMDRGGGGGWEAVQVIGSGFGLPGPADGQLAYPMGVGFCADGREVCVADRGNRRMSVFRVVDGAFVRHMVTRLRGNDMEEVENNWALPCVDSNTVEFVDDGGHTRLVLGKFGTGDGEFVDPMALALVPGLGLVVREYGVYGSHGRLQVFATPDMVAVQRMAPIRVAWMAATARASLRRNSSLR